MPVAVAVAGFAALAVAMGIGRFAFTPILPMMQDGAGLTLSQGAWLASANYLGYLAGALSAIGMRVRPGAAIRAGLVLVAVSTLAMAAVQSFALWLALRAIAGVASAWLLVFVSAWALERLAAAGRPQLGGTVYAGVGAGIVLAGLACLVVMSAGGGYESAWLVLGGLAVVVAAALWSLPGEHFAPAVAQASSVLDWNADFRRLVLGYGAFGVGYILPATFLPAMGREAVADPRVFGWAWPLFGAAALVSTLLVAGVRRTYTHRQVLVAAMLVMALGVSLPLAVPGLAGVFLAALCVGGTFMVATMAGMQEALRVGGAQARALSAAMTAAFAAGQVTGPLLASALAGIKGGLEIALALGAALLCAGARKLVNNTVGKCHA